ncbi:MAG: hypothetical protein JNM00_09505 [Flavobacteriales bacterium]|nr:hypothetical protein [Flavobacteriales bacterium]
MQIGNVYIVEDADTYSVDGYPAFAADYVEVSSERVRVQHGSGYVNLEAGKHRLIDHVTNSKVLLVENEDGEVAEYELIRIPS